MRISKYFAVLLALMLAFPALTFAQQADEPAGTTQAESPATDLALGEQVASDATIGATYIRETYGDWDLRCVHTEDQKDPCQLYQLMNDTQGNPVAEISLFELPPGQPAVAGATIAAPLETLLTEQVTLSVDGANAKRYPFSFCTLQGCYARIGLTTDDIARFRRGASGRLSISAVAAPDRPVALTMSLTGFTKGYAEMLASNAALSATDN